MTSGRTAYTGDLYYISNDHEVRVTFYDRLSEIETVTEHRDVSIPSGWRVTNRQTHDRPHVDNPPFPYEKVAAQIIGDTE